MYVLSAVMLTSMLIVNFIIAQASRFGIYLETYTKKNVEFYESFGFKVIDKAHLGEHNPTWHEKPITVYLVSSCIHSMRRA